MPPLAWQQLSRHADLTAVGLVAGWLSLPLSQLKRRTHNHKINQQAFSQSVQGTAVLGQAGAPRRAAAAGPSPDERILRATRAMQLKDYDTAARLLSQEAAEKPDSFIVYDLRAAACLHSGRHEQALDDAMHCTKLNPEW